MFETVRKWWRYAGTSIGLKFEETADPKVQLEQAIQDAREQHRQLTEQAANIIANQKQLQMRLDRDLEEYQKANDSARQALLLADHATKAGDQAKAGTYTRAAESYAGRIISLEHDIEGLKQSLLEATQASDRAKAAVGQNSVLLQKKLAEREALLSKLDQAKMQEQMNAAMAQLSTSVGEDVPTLDEVREKIDRRLAKAQATSDLTGVTVDTAMLDVERAQAEAEATAKLEGLRSQLGLTQAGTDEAGVDAVSETPVAPEAAEGAGKEAETPAEPVTT